MCPAGLAGVGPGPPREQTVARESELRGEPKVEISVKSFLMGVLGIHIYTYIYIYATWAKTADFLPRKFVYFLMFLAQLTIQKWLEHFRSLVNSSVVLPRFDHLKGTPCVCFLLIFDDF